MGQNQSRDNNGQAGTTGAQGSSDTAVTDVVGSQGSAVATVPLAGIEGFQIVRLLPFSPAHAAGLVPYFDIITSLDHVLLESEGKTALQFFKSYITNHRNQPVCFTVFNLHLRSYRDVYCIPSDAWGGGGLLGCSIEWSRADTCPERCVHVVDVLEGSPAAFSGELHANRDYIIGMQTAQEPLISLIKNQKDFYGRLEGWHEEQRWMLERKQRFPHEAVVVPHTLLFLVYNSENNTVKEVAIEMGTNPEAALGMSVATGLLHIIPSAAVAGGMAAATSLPVMNKFVQLEGNGGITSTPESSVPQTLAQLPAFHAQQQQEYQQQEQQQALQGPQGQHDSPQADAHFHPDCSNVSPKQQPVEEGREDVHAAPSGMVCDAVSAPPHAPLSNSDQPHDLAAAAMQLTDHTSYLPLLSPPLQQQHEDHHQHLQHMSHHPAYPMPPLIPDNFIRPPDNELPTSRPALSPRGATAIAHAPPSPPLLQSSAAHTAHSAKKSPFYSALASLELYEHPPCTAGVPQRKMAHPHAEAQQPQPFLESAPPCQPQEQQAQQLQQHPVTKVASQVVPPHTEPPVAVSTPMTSVQSSSAVLPALKLSSPPLPPQAQSVAAPCQPPVSQHTVFSVTHMPPPLNYPVFPGAAMKRQQK